MSNFRARRAAILPIGKVRIGAEVFAAAIAELAFLVQAQAAHGGDPGADPAPEAAGAYDV